MQACRLFKEHEYVCTNIATCVYSAGYLKYLFIFQ